MEQTTNQIEPRFYLMVPEYAAYDSSLSSLDKLVYSIVFTTVNTAGKFFMSNKSVGEKLGVTPVTVSRSISKLREKGYLKSAVEYKENSKEIKRRYLFIDNTPLSEKSRGIASNDNTPLSEKAKVINQYNKPLNKLKPLSSKSENSDRETLTNRFEKLWKLYPKKQGKDKSFKSYKKAVKSGVTDQEIKTGINNYLKQINAKHTEKKFIKNGSTWFNQQCWQDGYDFTPELPKGSHMKETLPDWAKDEPPAKPQEQEKPHITLSDDLPF